MPCTVIRGREYVPVFAGSSMISPYVTRLGLKRGAGALPAAMRRRLSSRLAAIAPHARTVLTVYLVTRLIVGAVVVAALAVEPLKITSNPTTHVGNPLIEGLVRWDAFHYAHIAVSGYDDTSSVAFFPLYPLLTKILTLVVGNVYVAGLIVSNVALLGALGYLYALAYREFGRGAARYSTFCLAAVPGAVFFAAMYTESLFALLVTATFYHAGARQWRRAALVGALAAATRNTGFILSLVVALEGLHGAGIRLWPGSWVVSKPTLQGGIRLCVQRIAAARSAFIAAAAIPLGLCAYMAYLGWKFADPLAFVKAEAGWNKHVAIANIVHVVPPGALTLSLWIDLLVTIGFVPLVLLVCLRMRPSYVVFTLITFLLSLDTGGIDGMTRYVLMLVPCYLIFGSLARWGWFSRLVLYLSLPLMAFVAAAYSHWGGPH